MMMTVSVGNHIILCGAKKVTVAETVGGVLR